jgi:hypothetical protein
VGLQENRPISGDEASASLPLPFPIAYNWGQPGARDATKEYQVWEFFSEWGGHVGVLIGVLGPNFGAYWSKRNTVGPKERALVVKYNLLIVPISTVALLGLAVGLEHVLPAPYNHRWSLLLVAVLLLVAALVISTMMYNREAKIQAEDSHEKPTQ